MIYCVDRSSFRRVRRAVRFARARIDGASTATSRFEGRSHRRNAVLVRLAVGGVARPCHLRSPINDLPVPGWECHAPMQKPDEREMRAELARLRQEHRDLDEAITALEQAGGGDQLQISRLKKRKLKLKDLIAAIEDRLFPDIIA